MEVMFWHYPQNLSRIGVFPVTVMRQWSLLLYGRILLVDCCVLLQCCLPKTPKEVLKSPSTSVGGSQFYVPSPFLETTIFVSYCNTVLAGFQEQVLEGASLMHWLPPWSPSRHAEASFCFYSFAQQQLLCPDASPPSPGMKNSIACIRGAPKTMWVVLMDSEERICERSEGERAIWGDTKRKMWLGRKYWQLLLAKNSIFNRHRYIEFY